MRLTGRVLDRLRASRLVPGRVRERSDRFAGYSENYRVLGSDESARSAALRLDGWDEQAVAARQHRAWSEILAGGAVGRLDVESLLRALTAVPGTASSVLEVGCASAYNTALIDRAAPGSRYFGLDHSASALALAAGEHPLTRGDMTGLPYRDRSVDVVLDGGALIHVPRWEAAVSEECRVAARAVILHTVTIADAAPTTFLRKRAYGYTVPEVVFGREHLHTVLAASGFAPSLVFPSLNYDLNQAVGIATLSETWVCERV